MASSDIANAIIIIVIFAIMQLTITLAIGIAKIKRDWETYKCNPAVIPLSGMFGYDALDTFNQCVLSSQSDFMSTFLNPVYSSIQSLINNGNIMRDVFQAMQGGLNMGQMTSLDIKGEIQNRVMALITAFNDIIISINDMFGKLGAIISVCFYLVDTIIETGKIAMLDLPGMIISKFTGDNFNNDAIRDEYEYRKERQEKIQEDPNLDEWQAYQIAQADATTIRQDSSDTNPYKEILEVEKNEMRNGETPGGVWHEPTSII